MSRRSLFTNITPLPANVSREAAVAWLHNHREMIELNPLVIRHGRCEPHETAPPDEHDCHWYEMTDTISYLGLMKGEVTYKGAFHNLPNGLQTHVYAPAGLDMREKWTVCGNMPGEPRAPTEIGVEAPRDGLYIREDVDMRCNFLLTGFVKKNMNKAHKVLVDTIVRKAAANEPNITNEEDQKGELGQNRMPGNAQELPVTEIPKELAACQCPDAHLPSCAMYAEEQHGRFSSDALTGAPTLLRTERIPYESFEHVDPIPTGDHDPELFSGKFHPVSHYNLLLGNADAVANAPPVPQGKLSRITAELPADPTSSATG